MFRHDLEHTGETSDVIENPEDLELKWKFKTGGDVSSSPVVSGDYIYVGSDDSFIYCFDKNTGKLKRMFPVEYYDKGLSRPSSLSPVVSGDYIYIGGI